MRRNPAGAWSPTKFQRIAKRGLMDAVSDRALMIAAALDESFAHEGISPQRIRDNSRLALLEFRPLSLPTMAVFANISTDDGGVRKGSGRQQCAKPPSPSCHLPMSFQLC
jgi:hypothetical protein